MTSPTPLPPLVLHVAPDGVVAGVHDDALVADIPGRVAIVRATLIEPLEGGEWGVWDARTGQVGDPLFRGATRAACLAWEVAWVQRTHLAGSP